MYPYLFWFRAWLNFVPAVVFTAAALCPLPALQLLQRAGEIAHTSAMPQEAHLAPSHEDVYAPSHEDVCYNEAPKSWSWRDTHLAMQLRYSLQLIACVLNRMSGTS